MSKMYTKTLINETKRKENVKLVDTWRKIQIVSRITFKENIKEHKKEAENEEESNGEAASVTSRVPDCTASFVKRSRRGPTRYRYAEPVSKHLHVIIEALKRFK